MKNKTRTTAARLDRFKKADEWAQRRFEEGFAVFAKCVATNNRAIRVTTWNVWQRFKAIDWWQEIKDAFPFFLSECVQKVKKSMEPVKKQYVWVAKPDSRLSVICKANQSLPPVFPVSTWNCRCSDKFIYFPKETIESSPGRDMPEPINLTPYYVAVLVLCALLILDGFLTHWGFVDYSPILK